MTGGSDEGAKAKTEKLSLAIEPPVATITIDDPTEQNRLSQRDIKRLSAIVAELEANDSVHAVVLTGSGDAYFSAGLLNPDIRAGMAKEDVVKFVLRANDVFDALEALPQVVIAAINGTVMAGAVELALACDIRLATDSATLTMPEAKWGGFPGAGGPVRLPVVVGYGRALELICTGRTITAHEMQRIGLVEDILPGNQVLPGALKMAHNIGNNGPLATRGAKRIMRIRREQGFRAARDLSDSLRSDLEWSNDVDEGIAAHRENRQPRFTGK